MAELRQILSQAWDEICDKYGLKKNRKTQKDESADQRSAGQEQVARQPPLPTRQTYQKTPRLVSTRRAPLQQNE